MPDQAPGQPDQRLQDLLGYERGFWSRGRSGVAGVDEAGRGPLAGPVVAAAVILPPEVAVSGVRDSKMLAPHERRELFGEIRARALAFGVGAASVREIERINILQATGLAMQRALRALRQEPDHVVVDGLPMKNLGRPHDAQIQGDARVHCIACASVLAKVVRDHLMVRLAKRYPGFGWERNMGYGTPEHREALHRLGITPHHRRTFQGCQPELALLLDESIDLSGQWPSPPPRGEDG